ncbi:CCR4-NOT transcription complex subunit 7 isoform X1 [Pungitius pungitius]|uniref:CCR4-NOT transcription complex subunit 7 isoform X1 n=1 Tax=Pungitius pungitius TaxID=134920 RepID=UPI002E0EF4FB
MPAATVNHNQKICEVWANNLEEELKRIRQVIRKYNYIAMDTEFPGVVARPIGEFRSNADYQYQLLRCNVDLLKIIQLGLTFMNEQGEYPPGTSTWQFNFKFNITEDMYAQDSIELLTTSGIQFEKHEDEGIETLYFAELLMTSGVVLCDGVRWLSFHSGYDFGYLIKILSNANLPEEEVDFFEILRLYFPVIYDVKYLMKSCKNLKGGLQEVAEQLELERIGPQHQAGSDSLLTGMAFFKMREIYSVTEVSLMRLHRRGASGRQCVGCRRLPDSGLDIWQQPAFRCFTHAMSEEPLFKWILLITTLFFSFFIQAKVGTSGDTVHYNKGRFSQGNLSGEGCATESNRY